MSWWERAYLLEIVRGLSITGGVFMRNMWRWMTFRKGALTTYYPEETRADYAAAQPRQARADAAPRRPAAVHRLQHVRDGVPGEGDRDRGRRSIPDDPAHPEVSGALRDRLFALHLLRAVRRGLPGGRDPHGQGSPRPAGARSRAHVAVARRAAQLESAARRRQALSRQAGAGKTARDRHDRDRPALALRRARRSSARR